MNENGTTLRNWLDAMAESTLELATQVFGFEDGQLTGDLAEMREGRSGAYISLVNEQNAVQVGLASDAAGCLTLARALFGMEAEAEELSESDVADAINEVVNIIAGGVKSRMHERSPSLRLGLPLFVEGRIKGASSQEELISGITIGPVSAELIVLRQGVKGKSR